MVIGIQTVSAAVGRCPGSLSHSCVYIRKHTLNIQLMYVCIYVLIYFFPICYIHVCLDIHQIYKEVSRLLISICACIIDGRA